MGTLVALNMAGGPSFVDELTRAWDVGDAVFPVDQRLPPAAVTRLLDVVGAGSIVSENGQRTSLDSGRPTEPGDAVVVATSGSTGEPKGVVLTRDAVDASAQLTSKRLNVTRADHWLACLPLAHIGGLAVVMRALLTGTELTVLPRFDVDAVESSGATLVSLVTAAMRRVDATLFRAILLGGAVIPPDRPLNAIATYGMTETGSGVVYDHYALDDVEVRADEDGQLWVKSPTLLRCYSDGTDPKTEDGWFATGDGGTVATDGRVEVSGRIAEVINTGGEKVWPAAVERALKTHPGIADALVFGEPDGEWGERVVAIVETDDVPTITELRDLLDAQLPSYAVPKEIRFVKELERTSSGKVIRRRVTK